MESLGRIFLIFLRLGCISFGGPTAHLSYFQDAFTRQNKWVTETQFADLIALCQFLPGPASSQVGLSLGYLRGGKLGALAAWAGFTLPSAVLMTGFALGLSYFTIPGGALSGLKVAAVAVVARAVWTLFRKLCPDTARRAFAILAVLAVLASGLFSLPIFMVQLTVIIAAAIIGVFLFKPALSQPSAISTKRAEPVWLVVFFALLAALPALAYFVPDTRMADVFYRTGALVFGGGHVVLPILESQTAAHGWIDADNFMAGYGAAQALPGPLFAFSAFIGGQMGGIGGAVLALSMIYLPSFLLIFGIMPYWSTLSQKPKMRAGLMGVNAAVVGILGAALYDPVWTSAMTGLPHIVLGGAALVALSIGRLPPWLVVIACAGIGIAVL